MDKLRILIIDDNEGDRRLIQYLLTENTDTSVEVIEAENAKDGIRYYKEMPLDCVLLDYRLPDMDGLAVLKVLRDKQNQNIPIIMMTGQGNEQVAVLAMKEGVNDYIVKSDLNATTLKSIILNAINTLKVEQQLIQIHKLEEEKKIAEEEAHLKTQFLENMSHELRTPLNAIIGLTDLMCNGDMGPLNEEQKSALNDILSSGKNLFQLISNVLEVSEIEADRIIFSPESMDLPMSINEVVDMLMPLAIKKEIKISTEVDPSVSFVFIDKSRFKQLLTYLLQNAIKFTPESGTININIKPETSLLFRLEVKDSGIGIAPGNVNKIFKPFQQIDVGVTKRFQGAGLSLYLTKRIVEAQGGQVGVTSVLGKGSVFYVILPRSYQDSHALEASCM